MKRICFSLIAISILCLSSCKYGLHELFGREDEVNERSDVVKDLSGTKYDPAVTEEKFSVLLFNDTHFGRIRRDGDERNEPGFFAKLAEIKPDIDAEYPMKFAICNGDSVEVGTEEYFALYSDFCDTIKTKFSLQVYSGIGNHDLYNGGYANWKKIAYQQVPSYKFTTGGADKISWYFLDSGNGSLGKNQLESFEQLAMADPNPKIIVMHYPIYADGLIYFALQNRTERDKFISILAKTNVKKVFSGHSHYSKVDCDYGDYFTEHITRSYLDCYEFAVLFVDNKNGTCRYERYKY